MKKTIWYLVISFIVSCVSCKKNNMSPDNNIVVVGFLQKAGITTYQYGSHYLTKDKSQKEHIYALSSSNVNLDNFLNQQVRVVGKKRNGYPVDGGPDYLEVESIQKE
ncbi:hypothetical protein SAMN04515674_10944 [Pseudarcicella hirudinis]|uniref:Uncharacterized protein n=1 Tax=Pseudarcicella hirudinis TaxID=1079859 RepID=A0A1I5VEC6_9BACT|nr:hypothetical protein [Pseudarcicella hirudinis]SFQ05336.1 hypothetical protein SAMN04515674_10944 [Pseudarcicella hirudinis]